MRLVWLFSLSALFVLLCSIPCTAFAQQKELAAPFLQNNIDQNWFRAAQQNIEHSEYFIRWQEKASAYQSPNRAQNLRFTYFENGFKVQPRTDGDEWQVEFRLKTVGRGEKGQPIEKMTLSAEKNTLKATGSNLEIQYRNDEKGMRQDFIVKERPKGNNNLRLGFEAALSNAALDVKTGEIVVSRKGEVARKVMRYAGLKVWDKDGKCLKAWMEQTGEAAFAIVVEDKHAAYPLTVDPTISTPWHMLIDQAGAMLGFNVGTAGDVNGDTYDDVIMSAPYFDNGHSSSGAVFVYHGSASGLGATGYWNSGVGTNANWMAEGNSNSAYFGWSAGTAGDVNHDGFSDVIVGAYGDNKAYVYYGSSGGLSTTPDWTFTTSNNDDNVGWGVGTGGDVNNDSYDDVIVAARYYNTWGAAFVFHGSEDGLSGGASSVDDGDADTVIDGPTQPGWDDEYANPGSGSPYPSWFGFRVGCAGKVNNDNYDDVFVTAYRYDDESAGTINEGAVYVYYGSSSGVQTSGYWMTHPGMFESPAVNRHYNYYGIGMGTAGDVNEDGYDDVVVGSYKYPNDVQNGELGSPANGKLYLFYGSSSGLSTTPAWDYEGNWWDGLGYSVKTAGDVDGDGHVDLIAGCRYTNSWSGKVLVFFGTGSGSSPYTSPISLVREQVQLQLGISIAVGELGIDVGSAGDIDQDGYSDIIIGAWSSRYSESDQGLALVYYGGRTYAGDFSLPVELTAFTGNLTETGARLNWTTETETDNLGFVLLRNGSQIASYQSNNQLKGQGTTAAQTQYTFFDAKVEVGKEYTYKLKSIDLNGTMHEYDQEVKVGNPDKYELSQNYPNPFNPVTTIRFSMEQAGRATLTVYDMLGRAIKTTSIDAVKGWNQYAFDGSRLASGVYFYRLVAGGFSSTKKMMLVK